MLSAAVGPGIVKSFHGDGDMDSSEVSLLKKQRWHRLLEYDIILISDDIGLESREIHEKLLGVPLSSAILSLNAHVP